MEAEGIYNPTETKGMFGGLKDKLWSRSDKVPTDFMHLNIYQEKANKKNKKNKDNRMLIIQGTGSWLESLSF